MAKVYFCLKIVEKREFDAHDFVAGLRSNSRF